MTDWKDRYRVCQACPERRLDLDEARARGSRFASFCSVPVPYRTAWPVIDRDFLSGCPTACPLGLWGPATKAEDVEGEGVRSLPASAGSTLNIERPPAVNIERTCVFGEPECRGCRNRPKVRCHRQGIVLPASACASCAQALPPSALHIGAVITAWNEGDEVAATIESLRASVREARLSVILVDDGSTDGSCGFASPSNSDTRLVLVRHEQPAGVGRSRNAGWSYAADVGCHVVTFHDGHMRFPEGVLEKLAVRALQQRAIVCSASRGIPSKGTLAGCHMHYDARYGLQPKWATGLAAGWQRTPCMMGAGYVMSAETARELEDATGSLWEDTAGRWGFSEQALSIKAYLLGIPVLTNRELVLAHRYRDTNPVPGAACEVWKNVARATAVLFGRQVYEQRFGAWCRAHVPTADLAHILAEAAQHAPASWRVDPDTVWTHLIEENASAAAGVVAGVAQPPTAVGAGAAGSPPVTICLLNYRRPDNLAPILESIAAQTVHARVMLWNNGEEPLEPHAGIDLVVHANANLGCFPRWWLAGVATTEWVCSLDDDLCFGAPDALEAAIAAARGAPGSIVGAYGLRLVPGRSYRDCLHVNLPAEDTRVDIVKGRFMLLRRALLERVPLHAPTLDELGEAAHCVDDIRLSLCIGAGRPQPHLLAGPLRGRLKELPAPDALSGRPGHYERRQRAVEILRTHSKVRTP